MSGPTDPMNPGLLSDGAPPGSSSGTIERKGERGRSHEGGRPPSLAVVLIARNQDWNIERLIDSVLAEVTMLDDVDILLVDSASTDRTVDRALDRGVRVVRLDAAQRLTAAAGRAVGLARTRGEYVLFLDGDMQLVPGWLAIGLATLAEHPAVGVLSGEVVDLAKDEAAPASPPTSLTTSTPFGVVPKVGGAALYRRTVLERAGGFNAGLFSDEEPELCLRIRAAGYFVARNDRPIVHHFTDPFEAISTLFARRRRNLYLGYGQALRSHWGTSLAVRYAWERGFGLSLAAGLLPGLAALGMGMVGKRWHWLGLWSAGAAALLGVDAVRRGSARKTLFSVVQRLLIFEGTVRGSLVPPASPRAESIRATELQPRPLMEEAS